MSAVIEFFDCPFLISAGHDGFDPFNFHPFDSIFVQAYKEGGRTEDHYVELWLPYNETQNYSNTYSKDILVHRSGFLWHDRLREIIPPYGMRWFVDHVWLSEYGFTISDPRTLSNERPSVLAVLPGSPMKDSLDKLWRSKKWRSIMDYHTRNREWMPANKNKTIAYNALRYERDTSLISRLKSARGSLCQICGFTFKKADGTDYAEVHHLESLAHGGLDVAANCLVLCANCHKQFHFGDIEIIKHTAKLLIVKIDDVIHSCKVG